MPLDPSFYCESCGKKVSSGMDKCPGCGQEFDSVLCPSCGFKGASNLFKQNCPQCGYESVDGTPKERKSKQKNIFSSLMYKILIAILVIILFGLIRAYLLL